MRSHKDFILSPITTLLNDVVTANAGIGSGIETFPLGEYVMQSAFLKMTGFQEQKMKCICWELATYDYEYRYMRYSKGNLGECSTYGEKKQIYKDLIDQIKKRARDFNLSKILAAGEIKNRVLSDVGSVFQNTNLSTWSEHSFLQFSVFGSTLRETQFGSESDLLDNILQDRYAQLYKHRNRCAHNTMSYQQNLPAFEVMADNDYVYDNYFTRFAILMLIDEVFVRLYSKYLDGI